jgi:hypothetical protein
MIRMIKTMRMRWTRHHREVHRMLWKELLDGRENSGNLSIDIKII